MVMCRRLTRAPFTEYDRSSFSTRQGGRGDFIDIRTLPVRDSRLRGESTRMIRHAEPYVG